MVSNNQSRKALWLAPDKIPSGSTTVIRPSSLHWSMALMRYRYSAGYFFDAGLPLKNGLDIAASFFNGIDLPNGGIKTTASFFLAGLLSR